MDTTTTGKIITANAETAKVMNGNAVAWSGEEDILLYEFYDYEIPNSPYFIQAEDTNNYKIDLSQFMKGSYYVLVRENVTEDERINGNSLFMRTNGMSFKIDSMSQLHFKKLTDKYNCFKYTLRYSENDNTFFYIQLNYLNSKRKGYFFKLRGIYNNDDNEIKEEDFQAIADFLKDK